MNEGHTHEIKIDKLLSISEKLVKTYFIANDIYSLLTLSMMTVTTYSRKNKKMHIKTQARIEIAINILPHLIDHLYKKNIINQSDKNYLFQTYNERYDELPSILENYLLEPGTIFHFECLDHLCKLEISEETPSTWKSQRCIAFPNYGVK